MNNQNNTQPATMEKKIDCPHCGSCLLWSEDRGAHCDVCDDFDPDMDLPTQLAERPTPITDEFLLNRTALRLDSPLAENMRDLERQLAEAREQRDSLAIALRTWRRIAYAGTNHEGLANARHQTDAALATLKEATNEPR